MLAHQILLIPYICLSPTRARAKIDRLESKSANNILAEEDCTPTEYADKLGLLYSSRVTGEHKKDLGQFFTPMKIAQFMAGVASMDKETITILDPGCGIGILSAA